MAGLSAGFIMSGVRCERQTSHLQREKVEPPGGAPECACVSTVQYTACTVHRGALRRVRLHYIDARHTYVHGPRWPTSCTVHFVRSCTVHLWSSALLTGAGAARMDGAGMTQLLLGSPRTLPVAEPGIRHMQLRAQLGDPLAAGKFATRSLEPHGLVRNDVADES